MEHLLTWRRLRRNRAALLGCTGSFLLLVLAVVGPWLAPCPVDSAGTVTRLAERLEAPSLRHWLGTDQLGTDVLSLLLHGGRLTIEIGVGAALLCTLLGAVLGMVAGYYGSVTDAGLMRITDVVLAFPSLILAILVAASLGAGALSVTLSLVLTGWAPVARIVRGAVLSLRQEEFILAARSIGCSGPRILWRHVFPNCFPLLVVLFTMRVGIMVLAESSLSFLGLGTPAGTPSWGVMVDTGRTYIDAAPWVSLAPATAIAAAVFAFSFLGDGLRDTLDPRLKGRL